MIEQATGNLTLSLDEVMKPILLEGYLPYNADVQICGAGD